MGKRQRLKDGAIIMIPLGNDKFSYGRIVFHTTICIYDLYTNESDINQLGGIENIIELPILFYVSIYKNVITKGEFVIVGSKEITINELNKIPPVFTQDIGNIDDCQIWYYDKGGIPCKKEDCVGLEVFAVYESFNLILRINDYYEGRVNSFIESTKVKL